jgi:O-methyltransferase
MRHVSRRRQSEYRKGGHHADTSVERVERLIASLALDDVHVVPGVFPDETGAQLASRQLRLVHVDVDTARSTEEVMAFVWPRLSVGGVVVVDYGFQGCDGVTGVVERMRSLPPAAS